MHRGLQILLVAAVLALGWNMSAYPLLEPDEGRNAEVAREMAETNDYLVPHLDGLPYLDKPVVYFAASALFMEFFGPTELAARLPAYFATLATIVLLVSFARRRWGTEAGWVAGIAFATMPLTLAYAHTVIFDSTLSLCTTAALIWLFEGHTAWAWAAMALGGITKGPIALAIPLVAFFPYALTTGVELRRIVSVRALVAFALVGLPWFIAVTVRMPEFPHYAFIYETFQRLTTERFHRTGPFWYYLPILPVATFPWIVPACARLSHWKTAWRGWRESASREALWLTFWVLGPLLLFSLNQSKLPQYVLPLMPAFALAAARTLVKEEARVGARAYAVIVGVVVVALAATIPTLQRILALTDAGRTELPMMVGITAFALVISAAFVVLASRWERVATAALGYGVVVMMVSFTAGGLLRAVSESRSSAGLAAAIMQASPAGEVLAVATFPTSLPFYLGHTIQVATADPGVLTSNYIAAYEERLRVMPRTRLQPGEAWRPILAECPVSTVFVVRSDAAAIREDLRTLPLILDDGRNAAYGPCIPRP